MKLTDKAVAANVKAVIFNGKVIYRVVREDSVSDDTVLALETQENDDNNEQNVGTVSFLKILISQIENPILKRSKKETMMIHQLSMKINFALTLKAIEKQFIEIEDHLIGLSNPKSTTGNVPPSNFYTELLKLDFGTGKPTL